MNKAIKILAKPLFLLFNPNTLRKIFKFFGWTIVNSGKVVKAAFRK